MPATLIVRLPNWLGDTVMAAPALAAVRRAWPDRRIVVAGPWVSVLAGQGLADVLLAYPRAWPARLRAADAARALGADTALLLPNSLESALAARYWGAGRRLGFATGGRRLLLTDPVPLPAPRRHQVDEYLALATALGAEAGEAEPRLAPPPADAPERAEARALLAAAGAARDGGTGRVVGIHLGAAYGDAKVWPRPRVVELCRELARRGARPVLLGAAGDAAAAAPVVRATGVASLVGRDRPALLPALLSEVGALVSGDTGVAHLAAALGTRVVTLFGPTDPALTAPRGPSIVLRHPVPCAPCFYRSCPIEHPCLAGITAAAVAEAVEGPPAR
jgi:heptosyltransferase-2